jgi:hypothetical protein
MKNALWYLPTVVALAGALYLHLKPGPKENAAVALPGRLQLGRDFTGVTPWPSSVRGVTVSNKTLRVQTSLKRSASTLGTAQSICRAASGWVYADTKSGYEWQGVEVLDFSGRPWLKRLRSGDSCAP